MNLGQEWSYDLNNNKEKKVAELSVAQKKKLVKELKNASKLHARQAVQIEKSMKNQKKNKG